MSQLVSSSISQLDSWTVDPSVFLLRHRWLTTTNLSYRFPILETSATASCGTTGIQWKALSLLKKSDCVLTKETNYQDFLGCFLENRETKTQGNPKIHSRQLMPNWFLLLRYGWCGISYFAICDGPALQSALQSSNSTSFTWNVFINARITGGEDEGVGVLPKWGEM